MSRQDISIDAVYGECNLTDNLTNKAIHNFTLLANIEGLDNDNFCYGEVSLPEYFREHFREQKGIYVSIGYYPVYKELVLRLKLENENNSPEFIINRGTNKYWFPVVHGGETSNIRLSELRAINETGVFYLTPKNNQLYLYSGNETDLIIKAALRQNEIFLLKAFAGNLYQYPTTGVGLIDFLHGNFENTGLADKLQMEFENDKMIINNAYMDSQTGELLLEVSEKNG